LRVEPSRYGISGESEDCGEERFVITNAAEGHCVERDLTLDELKHAPIYIFGAK
jgi:hypothetical protein